MRKKPQAKRKLSKYERDTRESILIIGSGVAALGGYVSAEMVLRSQGHGWHWFATFLIAVLTYAVISIWQTVRR